MPGPPTWQDSRESPVPRPAPSQLATSGALDIFVDGHRHNNVSKMLFGLTLLRDASPAQIQTAILTAEGRQHVTRAQIESMLAA